MNARNVIQITPMMPMMDVAAAVRYFVDILGFQALVHAGDFAYLQRDGAAVRLVRGSTNDEERLDHGPRAFLFYVDVNDLAALHQEVAPRLLAAGLSAGDGPKDQTWGQREWWVSGPEGGLIVFGQEIVATPAAE